MGRDGRPLNFQDRLRQGVLGAAIGEGGNRRNGAESPCTAIRTKFFSENSKFKGNK